MRKLLLFLSILITLIALSCAKQSAPMGGPKDTIPPVLVRSTPSQKQLNYKSKSVELTFSEFITLNNPKDQIIITPTIGKDFKIKSKKKTAILEFENDLKDSTTYTINFRESIQDITEKNPTQNLKLAFSTGTYIDSLSIEGTITDILTGKEIKEGTVALYQSDTFNIFKHKPSYLTKSNDKGYFKIDNLKEGSYKIYAFEDKNKNLIVDSKSENYGFIASDLELKENLKNVNISTLHLDARPLKLTSARPYSNYYNIKTSKNIKDFKISSESLNVFSSFAEDYSNIKIYNTFSDTDSLKVNFHCHDSIGFSIDTTFYIKFTNRLTDHEKFSTTLEESTIEVNKGLMKAKLIFNKPVKQINYDSLLFQYDSINMINISEKDLSWNQHNTEVHINLPVDKKIFKSTNESPSRKITGSGNSNDTEQYLIIGQATFISADQDTSQSIKEKPKILREEETAVLIMKISISKQHYILQLLDKNYNVLQSLKNVAEMKIENLIPSSYIIRLVIDENGDGQWNSGNYYRKEEPEPITFYKTEKGEQTINLKANWEVGPLLITY